MRKSFTMQATTPTQSLNILRLSWPSMTQGSTLFPTFYNVVVLFLDLQWASIKIGNMESNLKFITKVGLTSWSSGNLSSKISNSD